MRSSIAAWRSSSPSRSVACSRACTASFPVRGHSGSSSASGPASPSAGTAARWRVRRHDESRRRAASTLTALGTEGSARMIDDFAKQYLHSDLHDARAAMLEKLEGLAEYDVRRPLTRTGTNLLGLIKHLTITEAWYFGEVFGRPFPEQLPWRDDERDARSDDAKLAALFDYKVQLADMWATEHESHAEIVDRYQRMWAHSDA